MVFHILREDTLDPWCGAADGGLIQLALIEMVESSRVCAECRSLMEAWTAEKRPALTTSDPP